MQFRNKLTGVLRKTERLYLEGQLDLYQYDIGKAWKVFKSVLNQNEKNKTQNPSTFVVDGKPINDPAKISNKFNNYSVEMGPKLTKN